MMPIDKVYLQQQIAAVNLSSHYHPTGFPSMLVSSSNDTLLPVLSNYTVYQKQLLLLDAPSHMTVLVTENYENGQATSFWTQLKLDADMIQLYKTLLAYFLFLYYIYFVNVSIFKVV